MSDLHALRLLLESTPFESDARDRILAMVEEATEGTSETMKLETLCRRHRIKVSLDGYVRSSDAAKLLRIEPGTLRNWRLRETGPVFDKGCGDSAHCRYRLSDLAAWKANPENK